MCKTNQRLVEFIGAIIGCGLLCLAILACCDSDKKKSSPEEKAVQTQVEAQLPWLATVRSNCEAYNAAPNEIKKSAVFRKNKAHLKTVSVKDVKGKLKSMSTDQGGSEVTLRIMVGSVEFATESLMGAIKRGSNVYKQVTDLTEGQCVIFSAKKIEAKSMMEQSKVCDFEYFAKFTDVKPCQ